MGEQYVYNAAGFPELLRLLPSEVVAYIVKCLQSADYSGTAKYHAFEFLMAAFTNGYNYVEGVRIKKELVLQDANLAKALVDNCFEAAEAMASAAERTPSPAEP